MKSFEKDEPSLPRVDSEATPTEEEVLDESFDSFFPGVNFTPPPELVEARRAILEALTNQADDPSVLRSAWIEYDTIGEQIADSSEVLHLGIKVRSRVQIGLLLYKALIFREVGDISRFIEELDYAETIARNQGFDDITMLVEAEFAHMLETLELSPELLLVMLKAEMSEMNREHLRDLWHEGDDLEDMIGNAYNLLEIEGKDADNVLTRLGIIQS